MIRFKRTVCGAFLVISLALGNIVQAELALQSTPPRELKIDFAVNFINSYDFSTSTWQPVAKSTTATVTLDIDAVTPGGVYFWGSQLQQIQTWYGSPEITSPFIVNLPHPLDSQNWLQVDTSFSELSNIDYSVSWPQTPLGNGPKIVYQFNEIQNAHVGSLNWEYIVGFNLYPGIPVANIAQRTGNDLLSYIEIAYSQQLTFSTGFNSRVYNTSNHDNLYGMSYQGNARITGYSVLSAIPIPSVIWLFSSGLGLFAFAHRRNKKHLV